ncbi:MAG TPA: methyltransferase domain-containing protein, partial [Stellaceae bacterium]|nr:methyltransferase domain-containing protein [Stellaceae bacterium]
ASPALPPHSTAESGPMHFDPPSVREFEHRGWEQAAACYRVTFAHATEGFVALLLDAAGVGAGTRVLDLACGPGLVAAAAAERGAVPVGVDFSAAMLAAARAAHPAIRFVEADADVLPCVDGACDAVASNFGVHHFPDPARALGEARRVLRPGGRIAFTSWAAPPENRAWKVLFDAVAAHGDPHAAQAPPSGGGLRRPEDALSLLAASGFVGAEARPIERLWHIAASGDLVAGFRQGTVRTAALIAAQNEAALAAINAAVAESLAPYRQPDGYAVPVVAILACGVKP